LIVLPKIAFLIKMKYRLFYFNLVAIEFRFGFQQEVEKDLDPGKILPELDFIAEFPWNVLGIISYSI